MVEHQEQLLSISVGLTFYIRHTIPFLPVHIPLGWLHLDLPVLFSPCITLTRPLPLSNLYISCETQLVSYLFSFPLQVGIYMPSFDICLPYQFCQSACPSYLDLGNLKRKNEKKTKRHN